MNAKMATKWLAVCACFACLGGMALADSGIGVFGSYWSPDDADESYGAGAKLKLGADPIYFAVRGSYFDDLIDDDADDLDLEAIPVDAGLELGGDLSDIIAIYAGGGATYTFLNVDGGGDVDDEVGWYAEAGLEIKLTDHLCIFGEAIWRDVEGTVENDDLDEITSDVDLDLSGFGVNVGLLLR
ncbi:MAG: outer membrane beta-barrel protein [Kiritimatiellae bacterium]|nr:outer membrane beta-barrel protein [Kiritimatiellia bacterium]